VPEQEVVRRQMHTNRPTNHPSDNYGDMMVFRFFKMAAVHHLGFVFHVTGRRYNKLMQAEHIAPK